MFVDIGVKYNFLSQISIVWFTTRRTAATRTSWYVPCLLVPSTEWWWLSFFQSAWRIKTLASFKWTCLCNNRYIEAVCIKRWGILSKIKYFRPCYQVTRALTISKPMRVEAIHDCSAPGSHSVHPFSPFLLVTILHSCVWTGTYGFGFALNPIF